MFVVTSRTSKNKISVLPYVDEFIYLFILFIFFFFCNHAPINITCSMEMLPVLLCFTSVRRGAAV